MEATLLLPSGIQKLKVFQLKVVGFAPSIPWPGALPMDCAEGFAEPRYELSTCPPRISFLTWERQGSRSEPY